MNRNEKYRSEIRKLYKDEFDRGDSFEQTKITRRAVSVPSKGIDVITSRKDMGYRVPKNVTDVEPIKRGIYVVGAKEKNPIVKITIPKGTTSKMNSIPKEERVQKIKKRNELKDLLLRLAIAGVATTILVMLARGCSSPTIQTETSNSSYEVENKQNIFDSYIHILQDEDLTEEKMKSMPKQIRESLEINLKSKLYELLNCEEGDEIEFYSFPSSYENGGSTEGVHVVYKNKYGTLVDTDEVDYQETERFPFEKVERTIDEKIAATIVNIDIMSDLEDQIKNGDKINHKDFIRKCKNAAKIGSKLENSVLNKDDDGNITAIKDERLDDGER